MGKVRVVYLVSADRKEKKAYTEAVWFAIADVRWWYRNQLGGATFVLRDKVEVVQSKENAAWFSTNGAKQHGDDTYFVNALAEANRLLGAKHNDPSWIWVIYCDGPGNKGRGGDGVCIMPEDDLLGLVGKHPTQKRISRWRGGLGHELGHALGLPHPTGTDLVTHASSLMWLGYTTYPKTYLTPADKQILAKSPFIYGKGATKSMAQMHTSSIP